MIQDCLHCTNTRKAVIIGCGFVGAASAFSLMESGLFSEIVLIDSNKERAEGEALDISHGVPFGKPVNIYAGNYDDIEKASVIIITAGANQKEGETRLDLVKKNISIFNSIIPEIKKRKFNGVLLVVANPVDILTTVAIKLSGLPQNKVIGSGTVLDSARLKYELGKHLNVDPRSVHAFIIGEHGDSEIPAWSVVNVSGVHLNKFCEMRGYKDHEAAMKRIADEVKNSAYEIIAKKKATYYGIAMSVKRICEAIVRDEKSVLPISSMMNGMYGIENVALSMPAIVGKDGFETHIPIQLSEDEVSNLQKSAETLKDVLKQNGVI
jgi:L-lactate dehydrogenase